MRTRGQLLSSPTYWVETIKGHAYSAGMGWPADDVTLHELVENSLNIGHVPVCSFLPIEEYMENEQSKDWMDRGGAPKLKKSMLEHLCEYLSKTPREQVKADWDAVKEWNGIGPTVEEYFEYIEQLEKMKNT